MIIVGDIGNSEVKICLFKKNKLLKKIYLKSHLINNNYLRKKLFFLNNIKLIEKIIFSSVVPKIYNLIKKYFYKYFNHTSIEIFPVFERVEVRWGRVVTGSKSPAHCERAGTSPAPGTNQTLY